MTYSQQYATVESLPVRPIRVRGGMTQRRLVRLCVVSPFVLTAISAAFWSWLNQSRMSHEQLLHTFLLVMSLLGTLAVLFWLLIRDVEISAAGIRNVGRLKKGCLFRWEDFQGQRVREGRVRFSYELIGDALQLPIRESVVPPAKWKAAVGTLIFGDSEADVDEWLDRLIRSVWARPESLPVPEFMYFRPGKPVMVSARGLTVLSASLLQQRRSEPEILEALAAAEQGDVASWQQLEERWHSDTIPWDRVEQVNVWQLTHRRRDFRLMTIEMSYPPEDSTMDPVREQLKLKCGGNDEANTVSVASAQAILALIHRYVDSERVTVSSLHGLPRSLEEWERRYAREVSRVRNFTVDCRRCFWAVCLLSGLGCLMEDPVRLLPSIGSGVLMLVSAWVLGSIHLNRLEARYADWKQQLTVQQAKTD